MNVVRVASSTLMPRSAAASRSRLVARMARPQRVRVSPTKSPPTTSSAATATMSRPWLSLSPPRLRRPGGGGGGGGGGEGEGGGGPGAAPEPVAEIAAEDDQIAVGEVERAGDAQDHGERQRHEGVEAPQQGSRDQRLGERV